jgi:hypothetical protein
MQGACRFVFLPIPESGGPLVTAANYYYYCAFSCVAPVPLSTRSRPRAAPPDPAAAGDTIGGGAEKRFDGVDLVFTFCCQDWVVMEAEYQ